ncbi:MAG: Na(+)/H(+) antiporter subunit B [Ectothiorhodospiraceae bacterium]|nr:Na(+)/H(+) antiporter subunit B [Ectothiorhodospiraceae bacterium]MCH8504738.1 Na(+)/H(+) antiporter subunit B [Ectothiorhodospiraceae bacterium]
MIVVDTLAALILVVLAWRCLLLTDLFRSIVLFIVFGLLMALAWARLDAPDLALAEAAIGAGLLGVLLLGTWRAMGSPDGDHRQPGRALQVIAAGGGMVLAVLVGIALHQLPVSEQAAGALALERLDEAATQQPVTAVLLNFRSYDTLLEMGVLLMALLGTWLARVPLMESLSGDDASRGTELLPVALRVFVPVMLLVGAYLIWAGTHSPGGAFQGGAVLAAAGVLLALAGRLRGDTGDSLPLRMLLVLGLTVFSLAGLLLIPLQGAFMAYPPTLIYPVMLIVEYSLAVSIAITLVLLYTGSRGLRRGPA